jgi:tRNA/tmRNA/rRNA uracil-C5-methylase (TrmA/RlmC/RlmD family)
MISSKPGLLHWAADQTPVMSPRAQIRNKAEVRFD